MRRFSGPANLRGWALPIEQQAVDTWRGALKANLQLYLTGVSNFFFSFVRLATTLAPTVRVNCICPGGIELGQPKVFTERYSALAPLGCMGTEDDFRGFFAFLCSPMSQHVTGQVLMVDGGWYTC